MCGFKNEILNSLTLIWIQIKAWDTIKPGILACFAPSSYAVADLWLFKGVKRRQIANRKGRCGIFFSYSRLQKEITSVLNLRILESLVFKPITWYRLNTHNKYVLSLRYKHPWEHLISIHSTIHDEQLGHGTESQIQ